MERALSAAGKLFLAGEYAVLWGGTSRIASVGPRTSAQVKRRDDRVVRVLLKDGALTGMTTPLGVHWASEIPPEFSFVARTIDLALRAHGREALGFDVAFSPSPVAEGSRKLGMGSSARAVVLAAEACRFVLEDRYDALKLALTAHSLSQGGKGSGGDVAASFAGGIIRYRRFDTSRIAASAEAGPLLASLLQSPPVDLWKLPERPISMAFVFAGESASTTSLIRQVEARLDARARDVFVRHSDGVGQQLEDALLSGDFTSAASAIDELQKLLSSLGPLETDAMRRVLAIAKSYGAAGKMSGAGGGDGCVLLSPSPEVQSDLLAGLRQRGFYAFALSIEPGLRGEARSDPELSRWIAANG